MLKVIIVDTNVLFREGLTNLLQRDTEIQVVAAASSIQEAIEKVCLDEPNLALVDADLPDMDHCAGIRRLNAILPKMQVVLLCNHESPDQLLNAVRNGARGYMPKNSTLNKFMASMRAIQRGEVIIPRGMVGRLLDELANTKKPVEQESAAVLTPRELDVLVELGQGRSNREIAKHLAIAENTVKVHVHNILEKLNLRNRRQAARYARMQGITHPIRPYAPPENGRADSPTAQLYAERESINSQM